MATAQIKYRSGNYKYQLAEDYTVTVRLTPEENVDTDFVDLATTGELVIKQGYAWDGPSGPSLDTKNFMRGSLVHDALYQIMRQKPDVLPSEKWRNRADQALRRICREDGMGRFRAWYVYRSVRQFGDPATSPDNTNEVMSAP